MIQNAMQWYGSRPFSSTSFVRSSTRDRDEVLREILCAIEGVESVRVLRGSGRAPGARDKVYVVLLTHDVRRDRRIIEIICQLDDVDIDLVPCDAQGMIPDGATPLRSLS